MFMEDTCISCTALSVRITPAVRKRLDAIGATIPSDFTQVQIRTFTRGPEILTIIPMGSVQAIFSAVNLVGYTGAHTKLETVQSGQWWELPEPAELKSIYGDKQSRAITERVASGHPLSVTEYVRLAALDPTLPYRLSPPILVDLLDNSLSRIAFLEGHQH